MNIFQICGLGILISITALLLKEFGQERHFWILTAGALLMASTLVIRIDQSAFFEDWLGQAEYGKYFPRLQKGIGICVIVEISSGLCKDNGAENIGRMLEWIGKVEILLLALPLVQELWKLAGAMLT